MPASVNIVDLASGTGATLATPGVTPGGSNRAVWVGNICWADSTSYSDHVQLANAAAVPFADVDEFVGADVPLDIFSFTFAWAKTFGESGIPGTPTRVINGWPTTQYVNASSAIYVEDADPLSAFGTEQIHSQQFLGNPVQTVTGTHTGLEAGQLVLGKLFVFSLGDTLPTGYAPAGDVEEVLGETPEIMAEGRHVQIVPFFGHADGSGTFDANISVTTPNTGELVVCKIVTRPVNEASGGPTPSAISAAVGAASSSPVTGRSTAIASPSVGAGAAASSTLQGRRTVSASLSAAVSAATSSSLIGQAVSVATASAGNGAATVSTFTGSARVQSSSVPATAAASTNTLTAAGLSSSSLIGAGGVASASVIQGGATVLSSSSVAIGLASTFTLSALTSGSAIISLATGAAIASSLTGLATSTATLAAATGGATTSSILGSQTVASSIVAALGMGASAAVPGRAISTSLPVAAVGLSQATGLAGSSLSRGSIGAATGLAQSTALIAVDVLPEALTSLGVTASWNEWETVLVAGRPTFRLVPKAKRLTSSIVKVMPASIA